MRRASRSCRGSASTRRAAARPGDPEIAARTGPKATRGFSPSPSMSAPRSASSIWSCVHASAGRGRAPRGRRRAPRAVSAGSPAAASRRTRGRGIREQEAQHARRLAEQPMRSCTSGAASTSTASCAGVIGVVDDAGGLEVRHGARGEVADLELPDVVAVDRLGLLQVEARRVRVDVLDVERRDELVAAEHVAVGRERPAEQREVVDETLGDEAPVAVVEEVRLGVALGELLVALAHDVGQVAEARHERGHPDVDERVVQRDLPRRRRAGPRRGARA